MLRVLIVILVVVVPRLSLADPEHAELPAAPGEDEALYHCKSKTSAAGQVAITFKPETDLKDLITWTMGFTCKNFMFDPSIVARGKKVTVIAPAAMTPAQAYRLFLDALATIGLTVVPKGSVLRIVEAPLARTETVPLYTKALPDNGEQVVRYLLHPTFVPAATLQTALGTMKSQAGDVQVVGSSVMLVDYASSVRDMLAVAKQIDLPTGTDGMYTIQLHHADADKLVKEIEPLLAISAPQDKSAPAPQQKLLVDQRTNTIIFAGTEAAFQRTKLLVERLDIEVETETGGTMHVYQLKHAVAEEVAKTLNDAIAGRTSSTQNQPQGARPGAQAAPATPVAGGLALEGSAHINFDKATNKLIVMSTGRDYFALKNIIQELDEPRRQIYIEAVILEVNVNNGLDLSGSLHGAKETSRNGTLLGGVQGSADAGDLRSTSLATMAAASGFIGGWVGPMLSATSILGQSVPSYAILFNALGSTNDTKVLSAPSIIALDNEEAKYEVGTVIPYQKGSVPVSSANPTSLVTTNIDHEPLTLTLDIKAHVSDDEVMLEIKHEAKDFASSDKVLGPSWTTRKIETRTVVKDQQTVVIGGLMQEKEIVSETKWPIIGDIPILGYLFKASHKKKEKTNLMIMLTPYILRDQLDLQRLKERHLRDQAEFLSSKRSLESMKLDPKVDYRRKRGLVEEINRSVLDIEDEAAQRAEMMKAPEVPTGPVAPRPEGQ